MSRAPVRPSVHPIHEGDPEVIAQTAETLRHRRETGIPEAELVEVATLAGVWPYEVMEALDLSNQGGVFLPKPPRVEDPAPLPETLQDLQEPVQDEDLQTPAAETRTAPGPVSASWRDRLAFLSEMEGDVVDLSIQEMLARGWPVAATKHAGIWGKSHRVGSQVRALGWTPKFRDGRGVSFRRGV